MEYGLIQGQDNWSATPAQKPRVIQHKDSDHPALMATYPSSNYFPQTTSYGGLDVDFGDPTYGFGNGTGLPILQTAPLELSNQPIPARVQQNYNHTNGVNFTGNKSDPFKPYGISPPQELSDCSLTKPATQSGAYNNIQTSDLSHTPFGGPQSVQEAAFKHNFRASTSSGIVKAQAPLPQDATALYSSLPFHPAPTTVRNSVSNQSPEEMAKELGLQDDVWKDPNHCRDARYALKLLTSDEYMFATLEKKRILRKAWVGKRAAELQNLSLKDLCKLIEQWDDRM